MKITINLTKKETNLLKNVVIKYAPIDEEIDNVKDNHIETKAGIFDVKANDQAPEISLDFNEDLVLEGMKFGAECFDTIMTAVKVLQPMFTNFFEKARKRFSKWATDKWESVASHISKENKGKTFLLGLTKEKTWVDRDATHKELTDTYKHTSITEIGDIGDVINQADANKNEWRIVKFSSNGTFEVTSDVCVAAKWAEDMGMGYTGKRVTE